ncbi:MAG: SDR family NAD(P)-dependent oxidoreductase [Promethearchaeota archaeon]
MKKKEEILKLLKNKIPIWGYSPKGIADPTLSIKISKLGGIGLVDFEGLTLIKCQKILNKLYSSLSIDYSWGIRIPNHEILEQLEFNKVIPIIVCPFSPDTLNLQKLKENSILLLSEVLYLEEAHDTADWADLFLVKGNEAGGMVGTKNSFILIQEFHKAGFTFVIQGGFGVYNISSALVGGALGVILESQLYLFPECPLSQRFKDYIKTINETDFYIVMETFRYNYRLIGKLSNKSIRKIKEVEMKESLKLIKGLNDKKSLIKHPFYKEIIKLENTQLFFSDQDPKHSWLPTDNGICFSNYFLIKFGNLENYLKDITKIIQLQIKNTKDQWPFVKNSEFSKQLNISFPIIQGPMANISDQLDFAKKIANNGALPILALGGLLGGEADQLLLNAANNEILQKPYGCGIIGLEVAKSRREEHLQSISKYGPKIILIAAGTIELGVRVKNSGNMVLIHTPALSMFKEAMKKDLHFIILEGSECGGHIGILSSFILWELILEYLDMHNEEINKKINIIFAGGIINEISTAMLAVMIGNHLNLINPGIQMGSAYLLSDEIVNTGALSSVYQELLLDNSSTIIIGTTVNTRARVIPSDFVFQTIKEELYQKAQGIPISKRKEKYEKENLGALRIASKAEIWNDNHKEGSGTTQFTSISRNKQLMSGIFMAGDCISLQNNLRNISQIHYDVIHGGKNFIKLNTDHFFKETTVIDAKIENFPSYERITTDNKIAIVGLGAIFPDAENVSEFWNNIINKKYSIIEIPEERWDPEIFYSADHTSPDKTYSKIGGFIKNFNFKSIEYRIPPKMAERMDPVQKWAIVAAKEALNDAGYIVNGKERLPIAVIIGNSLGGEIQRSSNKRVFFNEIAYRINKARSEKLLNDDQHVKLIEYLKKTMLNPIPTINEDTMPGELSNIIAGRVSNVFNLTGKNMTTDAACASSLAAIDTGVNGLLAKDYDIALVGGADRSMDPSSYIKFCKIGALSEDGSYPFDSRANGFVMGEGAGFIVIKRLNDAIRDKNKIYAVISGMGASSDGKGKGITAPNPDGQRLAIERAFTSSKLTPKDVQYLECHGTSTIIGDATELTVLNDFFKSRDSDQKLAIGSIKSQIGHLKSAAGIASIIKTTLSLYHKIIPPSVNFVNPNPKINWETSPYYVNTEPKEWLSPQNGKRRAGVSAFGFGGTNYHMILTEYLSQSYDNSSDRILENLISNQSQKVKQTYDEFSKDLCFLFSGQGSQYVGMGKELYQKYKVVKNTLDKANEICKEYGGFDLLEIIFGSPNLTKEENSYKITQTEYTQPAIYSVEIALVNLFKSQNINPGIVGGHSLGEFTALTTADVLSFEDGLKSVIIRGRAMAELPPGIQCTMAAIFASSEVVEEILDGSSIDNVTISNYNSTSQTVISGEISAVESVVKIFIERGIRALKLNVSNAFHSKFVAHTEQKLKNFLDSVEFKPSRIPVFSNVTGKAYPNNPEEIKNILLKQITSPVRWVDEIKNIYESGGRKFIEVGPKKALFFFTKDILREFKDIETYFTLSPKYPEVEHLQEIFNNFLSVEPVKSFSNFRTPHQPLKFIKSVGLSDPPNSLKKQEILSPNIELDKIRQLPYFNEFLEEQKELLSSVLIQGFRSYIKKNQLILNDQYKKKENRFNSDPIVITGVGIGLPGIKRKIFDDKNIDDILHGINLIEPINIEFQNQLLKKNIVRLDKSPNGNAKFIHIDDLSKVIHLAGQLGDFNPSDDYQLEPKMLNALDIASKLAICAGYDALKDAGIPLVRSRIKTSTGKHLLGDWALPEELQNDTGIIFASAFPGYDNFAEELSSNFVEGSRKQTKDFNRAFLFRVLSMGHSQFAQLIKAKGPNTSTNAACASTPQAIGIAEDWIRTRRCKRVIVITADNVTSKNLFQWIGAGFLASGAATTKSCWEEAVLPFGEGRNGIILGSGASAFIIEQESEAKARGVRPIAEILGSYFANSAYHGTRLDQIHISEKLEEFVLEMEKRHGLIKDELVSKGMFVSHETYSPARGGSAEAELNALERTFGKKAYNMLIINTKGYTGHAMGAGIEEAVAIKSMEKGYIPPIANLNRIDPNYKKFNFSKGSNERKEFALRFAAGFGSQLAIVLFRLKSYGNRIIDRNYEYWLQNIHGSGNQLFTDGRVLKMKTERISPTPLTEISSIQKETTHETSLYINNDIINQIKHIISLKTGYDSLDIEETYDLEEDLGIDTVKQAEIFGEIRDTWKIEVGDSFNLADYRTINDIAQMLSNVLGNEQSSDEALSRIDISQLEDKLIMIISEKTGYDVDDIDVKFDLEEDLGVDTVKQAEIFGELRDSLNISEDTEINLAGLKNIKEIIYKIQEYLSNQNFESEIKIAQENIIKEIDESKDIKQAKNLVKKIIAHKTGYDIIDIEDSYDLEEDLGIDTVKQAEIFGELRNFYNIEESVEINVIDLRTPRDIVDFIIKSIRNKTTLTEEKLETSKENIEISKKGEEEEIYISQVIPSRIFGLTHLENNPKLKSLETLIININSGLSNYQSLCKDLQIKGLNHKIFDMKSEENFVKSLNDKEIELLPDNEFKILILIVPDNTQYSLKDSLFVFDSLFIIFQSINIPALEKIIVISPEENFGWKQGANPLSSSIGAFIKSINREFQIPIKLINSMNSEKIIQEILTMDQIEEVAYKNDIRYTLLRKRLESVPELNKYSITKEDILLATGGAQGITFACINELTMHVKPQLILLGLAPYDDSLYEYLEYNLEMLEEKKQELTRLLKSENERVTPVMIKRNWKKFLDKLDTLRNIEILRNKGLSVQYYAVDVTDDEKMKKVFKQIEENSEKPITIVVHGAGIEESKSFLKKNLNLAHKIVDVKIGGFINILKHINLQNIKYFIAFSSIAGRYGNQGQIDYAYANAFLSRLAWDFTQRKIPFLTIDWTAWADIGMAVQGSTLQILTQAGIVPVPSQIGVKIFSKLLLNNYQGEYIVAGKLGIFEEKLDISEKINKSNYPMLNNINFQSDFIIGSNTLNCEFDNYLLDHQIQQKPVFPGVMVIETFAEFYRRVFGKPLNSISDINFQTPLKIPVNKTIEVELKYNKSTDEITFNSRTYPSVLKGKPLIKKHFNAVFNKPLKKLKWKKVTFSEPLFPLLEKSEIYELFFHGYKFQVLKEVIQLEKEKIITKVEIPTTPLIGNDKDNNFQLAPLAIESVFQTAALFDVIINNHFSLPSKISNLEILSKKKPKYIIAEFIKKDEQKSYYNCMILSKNRVIIMKIINLEIIHAPFSVNLTKRLSDYLINLKEYYLLKNGKLPNNFHIIPIHKMKEIYQTDPKFLKYYLTEKEIENSSRFRNKKRKFEYFSGIITSKEIYLKYTSEIISYHDFEVQKDEKGKPFYYSLKKKQKIPINLSISHSHDFSVALISKNQVGIDLELIENRSPSFYTEVFTESERNVILEDAKLGTIYWTAKEAFLKAIGEGSHINFRDIELKYNKQQNNFTLKFYNELLDFNKKLKIQQLKSKITEKYVLTYCEI